MKTIELTQGRHAIVDDDDYEWLMQHKWHYHRTGYARRGSGGRKQHRKLYMHREIAKAPSGFDVDHINGNTLDNRKSNLRICTRKENIRNQKLISVKRRKTSVYKGVSWDKRDGRWIAQITVDRRSIRLGSFTNELDGALAYDEAARRFFGEFARTNFNDHSN